MSAPIDEVVDLLRTLRLPHMRNAAPDLLATAKAQRWEPAEAMRALLTEELTGRQASSIRSRRKAACYVTTAANSATPLPSLLRLWPAPAWLPRRSGLMPMPTAGSTCWSPTSGDR